MRRAWSMAGRPATEPRNTQHESAGSLQNDTTTGAQEQELTQIRGPVPIGPISNRRVPNMDVQQPLRRRFSRRRLMCRPCRLSCTK